MKCFYIIFLIVLMTAFCSCGSSGNKAIDANDDSIMDYSYNNDNDSLYGYGADSDTSDTMDYGYSNDGDALEVGCGKKLSKGATTPAQKTLKSEQEFITCDEIEAYYPSRKYNMEALDASVLLKVKLKLVEDGSAPEWAPKTITATGMIGCLYYAIPTPDTSCAQEYPEVYLGQPSLRLNKLTYLLQKEIHILKKPWVSC